ncbi:hypothetical protein Bequi_12755 [Brachybacterium sp. JHP9]|uniref:Glycosyltransferase n=1 Tax=Brachybacterium equifaecis TaxID=2910770 RepID=A0ABT0R2T4_9MICO|nr:hypothetical protein [Brachybacterium equifaecis]MCL6424237.1 hypothetical protein [Brachybacterium equifaecis]
MSRSAVDTEIIIACHSVQRPLADAVRSVLTGAGEHIGVRVVAHNISGAQLLAQIPAHLHERVRLQELHDGLRSPAGPFQAGLDSSTCEFVGIMGSDDVLEPGAADRWRALLRSSRADAVLARIQREGARFPVPTPPARPGTLLRSALGAPWVLDPLRDRSVYRSAPLGLMRIAVLRELGLALTPGLPVGEDVDLTTRLVLRARVLHDASGPAYVVRAGAHDRTTFVPHPLPVQLAFFDTVLQADLAPEERHLVALKLLRIHVFSALVVRERTEMWSAQDRADLARITARLLREHPDVPRDLSLADARLAAACLSPAVPTARLLDLARARRRHGRPATLLPADPRRILARQGALRTAAASAAAMLAPRTGGGPRSGS